MSELTEAFEGAVGLIIGGLIILMFASAVGQVGIIDLPFWGAVYIVVGILVLATVGAVVVGTIIGRLA